MVSDEKKEEIREAADLVDVIGDYVRLKRSGNGFVGLCPFHDEKTPSFHVTPHLGIYKCFGCGVGGDLFSFVMEMEGVGFQEALRTLGERYGVPLPEETSPAEEQFQKEKEGVYHALRFAGLWFYTRLRESEDAGNAQEYLEKRGYNGATIRKFGLGYAPSGGDLFLKAAKREGIDESFLYKADLIKQGKRGEAYDTFRDRLMFPIFNPAGKVIAFAGRVLGGQKKAKYINSAQTPVYNKSEVLFGVNLAKNEIRKQDEVILVEGYTDVITLAEHGIQNVVASAGTALTPQQVRILKRYGSKILMIYDSDSAGQKAMKRGMDIALAEGMEVDLLSLPDDEDPDSFVRQFGTESFQELKKKEAFDFVSFSVLSAERSGEMDHPSNRARIINDLLETISKIPDPLVRQVYVQHLHQKTQKFRNNSDRELFSRLEKILREKETKAVAKRTRLEPSMPPPERFGPDSMPVRQENVPGGSAPGGAERRRMPHYEIELIRLMLSHGDPIVTYIGQLCNETLFEDSQLQTLYKDIIERHRDRKEVSVQHYLNQETSLAELVREMMPERYAPSDRHYEKTGIRFQRDKDPFRSARSSMKALKLHFLRRTLAELAERIKTSGAGEKPALIDKQRQTQREISNMEQKNADELFPSPEQEGDSAPAGKEVFHYTMKKKQS